MKLFIEKEKMPDNPANFLRRVGYGYLQARGDKQDSFARRLYSGPFPRLHMYVNDRGEKWEFHLHMDQKAVSYEGSNAHSGEYEGPIIEAEIARLAQELGVSRKQETRNMKQETGKVGQAAKKTLGRKQLSAEERLGQGSLDDVVVEPKRKSFWQKLFS